MLVRTPAIALVLLSISTASFADTYPRQPGVDAIHYVFRLSLEDSSDRIAGETSVTVRLADGVRELWLDLTSEAGGKGMAVTSVTLGGTTRVVQPRQRSAAHPAPIHRRRPASTCRSS